MFPSFIGILDIQSWWEVPSIAYFCSLFRTAFNLLDFDIEELEEALLTDGTEESASSLLTELIVRLLNGCLGNNDISAFNYQMYLRRLFRRKCQETGRYNPFNTDIDFQFLPLRTKVEILYALCDFRLDANDIFDLFKNLEAESLRVEPLGWDDNDSAYWYFYGTRLYREDILKKPKGKNKKKKGKENKKRGWFYGDDWLDDEETERVWQVVCFTEEDWTHLTEKFSKATSKVEKELYRSLSQNFLPEIPRLFQEKERLQRKRLLELAPRRTSSRVLQKIKQKEEEDKPSDVESKDQTDEDKRDQARENRAKRRNLIRSKSESSDSSDNSSSDKEMPQKAAKRPKGQDKRSKNSSATHKGEPPPDQPVKTGRKTNNSLANATGQIVIPDSEEPANSTRKKLKTSQIFSQTEEDVQTDMYKVLEQLTAHEDAWPFMDPVEEEYAPNYYAVIRRPMDLHKMEERLDTGYYTDFSMFKADFKLIVNNCRLYNGQDNEYTMMVDNLQAAFDRLTEKYIHRLSSSDEEIAVEFQLPTPSRKHKLKTSESPTNHKRKKRKSHSDGGEGKSSHHEEEEDPPSESPAKESKESHHKSKDGKLKKKRKGHHRHGKHSKNHKKDSHHKSEHGSKSSKHSRKQKHGKDKDTKRSKKKTKKNKQVEEPDPALVRSASKESLESSNRSRSASPLPSIHTPSPEPSPPPAEPLSDPDFFKDKYDKIKERRRHAAKDAWESLFDYKQNKQKQNLHIPEKEKNQKLRETIEKLKAKNEKYKDGLFKNLFSAGKSSDKNSDSTSTTKESLSKDQDDSDFTDEETKELPSKEKHKSDSKKTIKKHTSAKNESASEALEQAVKDISKWLDDAPKGSSTSSPCDSPAQTISTEEQDNSRQDDEFLQDKSLLSRKEMARKRPSSREPKILKRREIQRTIDRLQPGKSKGNLLTTKKDVEKVEEIPPAGASLLNKAREASKSDESSPKLSLGSVLATVEFTLGNDHNFDKSDEAKPETKKGISTQDATEKDAPKAEVTTETKTVDAAVETVKEDQVVDTETTVMKPSQEKATPNLSAWFKAFGTPKSTTTTTTVKKRPEEEQEEKPVETLKEENKASSPKHPAKYDSPTEVESGTPEGGDSPLPAATATPRARRISTGSSVSERSSFSQDLDSPRHQISHTSPLLRSPASPRTDDFQKITYPIINGTVRAGFYQDTTSIKSSPEKSCSPREGPQSPYSPYSQHVYASNNAMGSSTPNYFADHNKSPLPTYGQNQPPPYYDTTKAAVVPKPRVHEDYTALGPDSFQQSTFGGPPPSPFSQGQPASYSQPQLSPAQTPAPPSPAPALPVTPAAQLLPDPKTALFPVKKRTYNEADTSVKKAPEVKENAAIQNKSEYQKMVQSIHTMSSVDDIAVALTEKSELAKINSLREKSSVEYMDRISIENRDTPIYDKTEHSNKKKETASVDPSKAIGMTKNDNIDMVNMGYMNPDNERRSSGDHEINFSTAAREAAIKSNMNPQPKGYEIDTIAMNLGLNNHNAQKAATKPSVSSGAIPPAHSQERSAADLLTVQNHHMMQQHAEYAENMAASGQSTNNFSLNDIELANKKLYSCSTPSNTALDYGNWKMTNQMRKQDVLPSDYAAYNAGNAEKMKTDVNTANAAALNYNKNLQQQQYHNYNAPRTTLQNLPSELRIPNPRGYLKNDHMSVPSSHSNSEIISKNVDTSAKSQKSDKIIQNHPLVGSLQYKTPYSTHSSLPLDSLRNLPNIPQMLERYTNDERYLSSFATASGSSLYHDKSFQMAQMSQMFNKSIASEVHPTSTSVSAYSQASTTMSKETSIYKTSPNLQSASVDAKSKTKRKRTSESKQTQQVMGNQSFHTSSCTSDVLSSVKSGMVPGSAFNFGASSNMALGSGLYGDNGSFSIEDLRNSTANQLMAANYMAAAAAARQPAGADTPPRQPGGAFPWAGSSGVRGAAASYATSPLYQQYLQRHQEELLRQTGAQIMGLYPPGYPAALAARQPYDRPSWL